jgi:hypothetical protein
VQASLHLDPERNGKPHSPEYQEEYELETLPSSKHADAAEIVWRNVNLTVGRGKKKKHLLKNVSGSCKGELMAIMGGSGNLNIKISFFLSF